MNDIKERLKNVLANNGVNVYDENELIDLDSLLYISVIVDIEEEFHVLIPDEYLLTEKLLYLSDFLSLISKVQ